jgi:hypothetical protein
MSSELYCRRYIMHVMVAYGQAHNQKFFMEGRGELTARLYIIYVGF